MGSRRAAACREPRRLRPPTEDRLSAGQGYMGKRRKLPIYRLGLPALLGSLLLVSLATVGQADEKQPKARKIVGLVVEVEPDHITVRGKRGVLITVLPKEDFTEKVPVGAQVTAWYFSKEGRNVLQRLEYPLENSFVSPSQFCPAIKKIIILPTDKVGQADGLFTAMASFLESRLGWLVAPPMLAEEIRRRARTSESTLDLIDASTGNVDLAAYVPPHRDLMRKLAAEARVDAVLEAEVELVQVNFRSQVAVWDGVRQSVSGKLSRTVAMLSPLPVRGRVPAATVVLKLWDPQGRLLWSNRRGFAVLALHVGMGNKFRDRPIPEVLADAANTEKWFTQVFSSWLLASKR